ncbi:MULTISPECIES: neuraminidase-like domain-containing protein [Photorhabdus]|uniref:Tc toxin subunit A-related protein n=1 Tax=Photorhabdus TaxID=29487 RepID=UPI00069A0FE0|nr:neuraminidase-like domain-containing protein [Photorhabdus thracensis]
MNTLTSERSEMISQAQKANRLHEASILKRANPQLQNAVHFAITAPHADQQGYNSKFGGRASQYVAPGAVASMFSPAAYLTELYRQARDLHADSSDYHLDKRRPDLQSLALSQKNMDSEISTLSLSNKVLLEGIKNKLLEHIKTLSKDKLLKDIAPLFKDKLPENIETLFNLDSHTKVMEALPNFRVSGMMPYHDAYERVRKIIQLQAPVFEQVSTSSETTIANLMYQASLLGINASVSPELFNTLTEEITEANANEKFKKNFGDIKLAELLTLDALKYYYNLTNEELEQFLKYVLIESNSTYTNNQLINISIDTSGKIQLSRITRTPGSNYNNLNYMNLYPIQNKHFYVDISYKKKAGQVSIRLNYPQSKYLTGIYNNTTLENMNYSSPRFQLAKEDIQKEFILLSYRYKENSHSDISDSSYAKFQIQNYSPAIFLLKLNKTILLSHATKLLPAVLEKIVFGINQELDINAEVLKKVFRVKYYMQRYGIDAETALILCKAPISKNTHDDHSSQFDRLFNTPKLNGQVFSDKSEEMIDLNPSGTSDWKNTVLKRAFNVDDTSFYRLLKIANRDNSDGRIINNIENLSHLYLAKLLADIHQLTIDELSLLLKTIGEEKTNLSTISHTALETLIDKLYAVISWLRTQKWSVYQLFMMTTTKYDITLTPEIQNLLDTVYNGLQGFNSENEANLLLKMSPYIAAALQLPSENVAHYVLTWADQLKPSAGKVTAGKFLGWLQALRDPKQPKSAVTQEQAVQYCQCLAQLTLIYRSTDLSESTLRLFVTKPQLFGIKAGTAPTHTTLITLTRFADWVNSLGENASSVLTEFEKETLTAEQLAKAMNLDENLLLQASTQAQKDFSLWTSLDTILQWVNIARQLNISPSGVSALMKLQAEKSTYDQWENVATILTAGLNTQQANTLHAFVDESRSAALSEYYIGKVSSQNPAIKNRDDLYQYLLIDNQVSAAIKTTPIAEAIASIQLYINRALKNMEGNAVSQVVNRPFFTDWDKYNKRYSTWASIAKLVYYPENYIDPTMRIGQTKMMDALLQSISQSQLNTDTVENAFMSYLTVFEQVANLEVVSAYHDSTNSDRGLTYFIGHSKTEVNQYYWRSVDHNKFNDGKFPANAWSEWYKIDCPINPYQSTIRPVIFQSRLYLIWLEQKKISKQTESNHQTIEDYHYELKLAHIRYDGTWSTPITVGEKVSVILKTLKLSEQSAEQQLGLYCSNSQDEDKLLVIFYLKQDELNAYERKVIEVEAAETKVKAEEEREESDVISVEEHQAKRKEEEEAKTKSEALMQGLYISSDMSFKNVEPGRLKNNIYKSTYSQFDTNKIIRVNNLYEEKYKLPSSIDYNSSYSWESSYFSLVYGGNIQAISHKVTSSGLKIQISPKLKIIHNWNDNQLSNQYVDELDDIDKTRLRNQYKLIKKYGKLGDKFIIYKKLGSNPDHSSSQLMFYPVYQYSGNTSNLEQGRLLFYRDTDYSSKVEAWIPTIFRTFTKDNAVIGDDYITDSLNRPDNFKGYIYMTDNKGIATDVSESIDINTAISPEKVKVTVTTGNKTQTFTADKYVSTQPSPSLEEMYYQFNTLEIDIPEQAFNDNIADINVTFTVFAAVFEDGVETKLGEEHFSIPITRKIKDDTVLTLHHETNGAQYMQWGAYRTRLNTLFANQLVSRATAGINTILNMETQNIQEPMMGIGAYVELVMDKYNPEIHGINKSFTLISSDIFRHGDQFTIYQGTLSDSTQTIVRLFLPRFDNAYGNKNRLYIRAVYQKQKTNDIFFIKENNNEYATFDTTHNQGTFPGLASTRVVPTFTEPMDFSGSNSLYFWELFYYVPMLIAQRLLHEQNFDEANRWLKYVWNPSGYIENGQIQHYNWNVRPLLEDTRWNDDPLNSVDPDAVAQYDPMHYKVATFMRTLDLLLDRGDYAYRQLERDTLNEAKMWYMQALHLLGDKPHLPLNSTWNNEKSLSDAANPERQKAHSHAIAALRQGESTQVSSQTDLFLPQVNEVMLSYWQKLEQRLYNLRHNLSIDGQLLHLPIYATPADPKALLSAAVANSQGGAALSQPFMSLWRFPHMLENARGMVSQLTQFGSTLQNIIERQDAEALNVLLQNQAKELILTNISIQNKTIEELDAEKTVLEKSKTGAQSRFNSYGKLYDENINAGEHQALDMKVASHSITSGLKSLHMAAAALDMVPNIYGLAVGGSHYGAIANAIAIGGGIAADGLLIEADKVLQSEIWRRRRQEWEIQRNNAQTELNQIDAQLGSLAVRREAAVLQKTSLKTQQEQTHAHLTFLQRKFNNQALFNWLRGRLAAIYFQFYDLAVSRCLMAEMAYRWETNETTTSFIKPGSWQGTHAGLLAGETLMLNLAQMEDAHLRWDKRALEVERTVSLADVYTEPGQDRIDLATEITDLLEKRKDNLGNDNNGIRLNDNKLIATVNLANLNIREDYPASVGKTRRIKQISVTLPALLGPYQDVQAILSYGRSETRLAESCKSLAVSHGMSDSGQFQLDFNNGKFLPFEGIAVDDKGTLILSFPNATDKQQAMLQTLSDIILHIRYTIR